MDTLTKDILEHPWIHMAPLGVNGRAQTSMDMRRHSWRRMHTMDIHEAPFGSYRAPFLDVFLYVLLINSIHQVIECINRLIHGINRAINCMNRSLMTFWMINWTCHGHLGYKFPSFIFKASNQQSFNFQSFKVSKIRKSI